MALSRIGAYSVTALKNTLLALPGMRTLLNTGSGTTWTDATTSEDMTLQGGATHNGDYVTFDGSDDYATSTGAAAWMTSPSSFAGTLGGGAPNTWNGSGITVFMLMRVQPGDLESRTWVHWFNGGASGTDYCRWMVRIDANGKLTFWNQYAIDSDPAYQDPTAPPAKLDRYFTIPVDLRSLIADGQWHLVQFSRSTSNPLEKKLLFVDSRQVYAGGTGNGVSGFSDFDVAVTFGKTESTTIAGDPAFSNFKGDVAMFGVRNRWTPQNEMASVYVKAAGGSGRTARALETMRALRADAE